ncbi:MAG: DciA family protein [Steroidobacteraceae bacterium]
MQQSWAEWLRGHVPEELAQHLVRVLAKPGVGVRADAGAVRQLVVFADSAAWSTRLRYALAAMQQQIVERAGAPVRISVRIVMESAASGR